MNGKQVKNKSLIGKEFSFGEIEEMVLDAHSKGFNYDDPNIEDENGNVDLFGIHKYPKYVVKMVDIDKLDYGEPEGNYFNYVIDIEKAPPILLNSHNEVLDGWHRVAAAKAAGKKQIAAFVPVGRIKEQKALIPEVTSVIAESVDRWGRLNVNGLG